MDVSKYRHLYVSETQENLEALSARLVDLEAHPERRETVDTTFRLFHSIKGMSGTMGYAPVFDLAHRLEDLMDRVRRGTLAVDAGVTDLLLAGVDRMSAWVAAVEAERLPLRMDEAGEALLRRVEAALGDPPPRRSQARGPAPPISSPMELPTEAGDLVIDVTPAAACADPGSRGFLLLRKLERLGEVVHSAPGVEVLRAGELDGPLRLVLRSAHPAERVRAFVGLLPEWTGVSVRAAPAASPLDEDGLAFTGDLGPRDPPAGEPVAERQPEPAPSAEERAASGAREAAKYAAVLRGRTARTIRVRTDWLDTLLDGIGDLQIISQRLWKLNQAQPTPSMTEGLRDLSRALNTLRGEAMSVRMTPFSVLTTRLPRVVRDLARQAGKRASLVVHGEDQQVDRALIEGLDAPITHLLRNAIEHGIEAAEVRAARGKRPAGLLTLECRRVRDEIVVVLRDDGGGVDRRRVVQRAVETGLLDRARAEALAERDLLRLLARPGLSSRAEAGALSGRGVGMDAVLGAVSALGGRVELETEPGVGTAVRLRLPRAPGISKLLLVEVDGQRFGLPLGRILRTDLLEVSALRRERGMEWIVRDAERLRVHTLRHLLGLPRADRGARLAGVIFGGEGAPFVVEVDRVVGQQSAVMKPLGALLERIEGLVGFTIDAVGEPVFVVDVDRFVAAS